MLIFFCIFLTPLLLVEAACIIGIITARENIRANRAPDSPRRKRPWHRWELRCRMGWDEQVRSDQSYGWYPLRRTAEKMASDLRKVTDGPIWCEFEVRRLS